MESPQPTKLMKLRKRHSELKTNRRGHLDHLSGRTEPARLLIKSEDNHVVGFLISNQQKHSPRIDGKVARCHASSRFVAHRGERTVAWINLETGDTVVAPVRTINESAIRGNVDVSTCVRSRETLRQSGENL